MDTRPIGVLDSGVGGFSIWQELVRLLPQESTIYVADSKNVPYGTRDAETIYVLARTIVEFLTKRGVKLIVVACNTISVTCLDALRKDFPKIPIIGIVPVIKNAAERSKNNRIGVLSTGATAKSAYLANLIQKFAPHATVITVGSDSLVPFVERGELSGGNLEAVLVGELSPFITKDIDTLALGCSHFPFLKPAIQQVLGPNVLILDSGAAVARHARRILENNQILSGGKAVSHQFYTTGAVEPFENSIKLLIGNPLENMIQNVASIQL